MVKNMLSEYEWDLRLYLAFAVTDTLAARKSNIVYNVALNKGALNLILQVIERTLSHLCYLYPLKYYFKSSARVTLYIQARIDQIIKDRCNETKKS